MLSVSSSYNMILQPFKYAKNIPVELNLTPATKVALKQSKFKDVRNLFVYLKAENRLFYENLFEDNAQTAEHIDESSEF